MKSVLIAIQPYYVFLIIARLMGWTLQQEKTVEVRKDYPKASDWNKVTHIYCSKNRKSFNRIPKEYQPFMEKLLGKAVGEFVCDKFDYRYFYIDTDGTPISNIYKDFEQASCLKRKEIINYILSPNKNLKVHKGTRWVVGWHISDLKIYDKPKELGEFKKECQQYGADNPLCDDCRYYDCCKGVDYDESDCVVDGLIPLNRPPQSWYYIKEL